MTGVDRAMITRRGLLAALGAGVVSHSLIGGAQPGSVASPSYVRTDSTMIATAESQVHFFTHAHTREARWVIAEHLQGRRLSPLDTVRVEYDSRLFGLRSAGYLRRGERLIRLHTPDVSGSGNLASATYSIPPGARDGSGELAVISPLTGIVAYPGDLIEDPIRPRMVLLQGSQEMHHELIQAETDLAVSPWGIELSAGWDHIDNVDGRGGVYRVPSVLRLDSVGPNPMPAGTEVHLVSDLSASGAPGLGGALRDGAEPLNGVSIASGTDVSRRLTVFRFAQPLPASSSIVLNIEWPAGRSAGSVVAATAAVVSSAAADRPQRGAGVVDHAIGADASLELQEIDSARAGG